MCHIHTHNTHIKVSQADSYYSVTNLTHKYKPETHRLPTNKNTYQTLQTLTLIKYKFNILTYTPTPQNITIGILTDNSPHTHPLDYVILVAFTHRGIRYSIFHKDWRIQYLVTAWSPLTWSYDQF